MPDSSHLLAFFVAAGILAAIPGPGMLYVLARTLSGGRPAGLRSTAGTALGGALHVCGAAVGVSAILMASATAFAVVRAAGAAYLVVLGVMAIVSHRREDGPRSLGDDATPRALGQGVVTELLNPKTALFFLTFLPQFVQPARGPVAVQMGILGIVTVLLNSSTDLIVVGLGSRLRAALQRHPRLWRRQRVASGVVLVGLGAYAATGQRS